MKKNCFFFLGLLCAYGFTCCQKQMTGTADSQSLLLTAKWPKPPFETNFFDPLNLVSRSQQGRLDTPGSNGKSLMAFDKNGNNMLKIPTGGEATNNVFAGKNNKLLIITGGGLTSPPWPNNQDRLTAVKMNVKGVEKFK